MTHFDSDYNNGAHPLVLQHLVDTNSGHSTSYGYDEWSEHARKMIRKLIGCPEAGIEFLVGGTQTNATVIDSMLYPGDGVIAVNTGHIAVHEAGAVEFTGHKVITLTDHVGKMSALELKEYMQRFKADETSEHMVQPGLVYITFPTELGTLYSAHEIESIYDVCNEFDLHLYIDGARLGYGLMSADCDFNMAWLAHHCHAFYIGGTKVGALCGEAVVFPQGNEPRNFFTSIKRHGAMLAKGRLIGAQFEALFTDNLYLRISKHAIDMAQQLRSIFIEAGYRMYNDSPTNQQFVVLPNKILDQLHEHIKYEFWEPLDHEQMLCRFVTSWATTQEDLDALKTALSTIAKA